MRTLHLSPSAGLTAGRLQEAAAELLADSFGRTPSCALREILKDALAASERAASAVRPLAADCAPNYR
jgi:hypothetical protein